jgi:hypothetical protein
VLHAKEALVHIENLSPSTDIIRWAWGLAARAAHEAQDLATERELVSMLDPYRPGQLGRLLSAERELCVARLAADTDADAGALFATAVAGLRERSTPYHLAHGLLDYASFLDASGRSGEAAPLVAEAERIGDQLRAASVLERVASAVTENAAAST